MKRQVKHSTSRILTFCLTALAGIFLAPQAGASLVAEWNGDFGTTKSGWTVTPGSGNTFANGVITMGSSAAITVTGGTMLHNPTIIVGLKLASTDTTGCIVELNDDGNHHLIGYVANGTDITANYRENNETTNKSDSPYISGPVDFGSTTHYFAYAYPNLANSGTDASAFYFDGVQVGDTSTALKWAGKNITSFSIGYNPVAGMALEGATISYIAIYDEALSSSTTPTIAAASTTDSTRLMYLLNGETLTGDGNGIALVNEAGYGPTTPSYYNGSSGGYDKDDTIKKYGNYSFKHTASGVSPSIFDYTNGIGVDTTDGFTLSFWVNNQSTLIWRTFFAFEVGSVYYGFENGGTLGVVRLFGAYDSNDSNNLTGFNMSLNEWHHIAFVCQPNNGGYAIYLDGTSVATGTELPKDGGTLDEVALGPRKNRNGSKRAGIDGTAYFDDIAIYKGALTAAQISAIASSSTALSGPVAPSVQGININFTHSSAGLTTTSAVGSSGDQVPGTCWHNIAGNNGTTTGLKVYRPAFADAPTYHGLSLVVSGTSGEYRCNNLTAASDLRRGYIDDNANNTTPTVTVSNIPFDYYRVLVYHACDTANTCFGYDSINSINFMGADASSTTATYTKLGNAKWGRTGAQDSALDIAEGVNLIKTPVLANNSSSGLTVAAHRMDGARAGLAAIQIVEETDISSVTFTAPSSDWTTLPTFAKTLSSGSGTISFGNNLAYSQIVDGRMATVVNITGGTFTDVNGWMYQSETPSRGTTDDIYVLMSGGSATLLKGVQNAHYWSVGDASMIQMTGNALVQLDGNASVNYVFGAGNKGGYSGSNYAKVTGDTGVTIQGNAVVKGSAAGGWSSAHGANATVDGNTSVLVKNVQSDNTASALGYTPTGFIIGGSVYEANPASSRSTITGNSSVTVDLESSHSGIFSKKIVGASVFPDTSDGENGDNHAQTVNGNSSVTIDAPTGVTFDQFVVGGGYAGRTSGYGRAYVRGNSSVTINGGNYTGRIVAGGYGPNGGIATVTGTATLTVNGGTFTNATLDGGQSTGARTLAVNVDVAHAVVTNFNAITIASEKTLSLTGGTAESPLAYEASLSGAGSLTIASGVHKFTGANELSGSFTVSNGATAIFNAGSEGTVTVAEGGTVKLLVSVAQAAAGYTATGIDSSVDVVFVNADNGTDYESTGNTLEPQGLSWDGDAGTSNWDDAQNWSTDAVPTSDDLVLITAGDAITVTSSSTAKRVIVKESRTLTGVTSANLGEVEIEEDVTLTVNTTGASVIRGVSGAGTLEKTGDNVWLAIKNGATSGKAIQNTTISIQGGVVNLDTTSVGDTVSDSPKFIIGENGRLTNYGWFTINGTLTIESNYEKTIFDNCENQNPACMRGQPAIVKNGSGTIHLACCNSGNDGMLPYASVIVNAGTLDFSSSAATEISGAVSGEGNLSVTGAGKVTFDSSNTLTGTLTIGANATGKFTYNNVLSAGTAVVNGTLEADRASTTTTDKNYSKISGTGTIKFTGDWWRGFPGTAANFWADTLTLDLGTDGSKAIVMAITTVSSDGENNVSKVGNLSGAGGFQTDYYNGTRDLIVNITKDCTWSGQVYYGSEDRFGTMYVKGDGTHVWTLSGTQPDNKTDALNIQSEAIVNLTGTWYGDATVAGTLKGTGTLSGALTFISGSTLVVSSTPLTATGAVSGTASIDLSGVTPATGRQILKTSSTPTGTYTISDSTHAANYNVTAKEDGLYLTKRPIMVIIK